MVIEKEIQARNFSSLDSFCLLTAIYISEHHTEEGAMGHHVGVLGHAQVTVETGVEFYFVHTIRGSAAPTRTPAKGACRRCTIS